MLEKKELSPYLIQNCDCLLLMTQVLKKQDFLDLDKDGIGLIALHVPERDSVHVGIYWNWEGDQEVAHFLHRDNVEIAEISHPKFDKYWFSPLPDFEDQLIDSLIAVADLVEENKNNTLVLDLVSVIYDGGTFDISNGDFLINNQTECLINCGVFVLALLETYDYHLINWESWPCVTEATRSTYLENWLNQMNVPEADRGQYYNMNKEIRGFHILASAETGNCKSEFPEVEGKVEGVLNYFKANPLF